MKFEYAQLPENPTKDQIKSEIKRLETLSAIHRGSDQGLKVILNSIYGVLGYTKFILYDRKIAETITFQSQAIIKFTIKSFNEYFRDIWHLDERAHELMGISNVPKYDNPDDVVVYADTDSLFTHLDGIYKQSGFKGSFNEFATLLDEHAMRPFITKIMNEYADSYGAYKFKADGVTPSMDLEMEEVDHGIIFLAKKRYLKNVSMEGSVEYAHVEKISVKGVEINKSSTPEWVRKKLKSAVEYIFSNPNLTSSEMNEWVYVNVKAPFQTTSIENICNISRVGKYNKFITSDQKSLVVAKSCQSHVRGAGYHNFLLYNSQFKNKYKFIGTSDRVLYYATEMDATSHVFSFVSGEYPIEFAPPCDRLVQFEKVFLSPLNNIISALGINPLNPQMIMMDSIF